MAEFLGDITIMFEVLTFAIGLAFWHFGTKEKAGKLLWGGIILTVVSVPAFVCTMYYYLQYRADGSFERSYPMGQMMRPGMMDMHGGMMSHMDSCMDQMKGQMMDDNMRAKMRSCMMGQMDEPQGK